MPKRLSLDDEPKEKESATTTTLEEQLKRYQQRWSAVDFKREDADLLQVRYGRRGQRGWWLFIPAALLLAAGAAVPFVAPLGTGLNVVASAALVIAAGACVFASRSCVHLRLGRPGLTAAPFPPLTGPTARVPLKTIRRFRVEKNEHRGGSRYTLNCLTREGDELPLIRNIRIKNDAYLVSMLLIDRVKSLRA